MNRRLYYWLRVSTGRLWQLKKWTDEEFEKELISHFAMVSAEEWKRYMDIAKKNHYSQDRISTEEMMYCYDCYKRRRKQNGVTV
jgi:hypothetical protein